MPSEKGLDYAIGRDGNAPKTLLAALLIFFRDVPEGAAFRERFAKNPGAARITMRAQAHLEQDGTCTIDNKSRDRVGVHRALGGEGLSACSGDILLESLVACAGVTLGQIAKAMEADSDIMLPVKYLGIVGDKLSAAGWSWGYCSAVTRKRTQGALIVRLLSKIPRVSRSRSCAHSGRFSCRGIMKQNCITSN